MEGNCNVCSNSNSNNRNNNGNDSNVIYSNVIYIYICIYIYIYITNYLQTKSCAMGTICAPYINIFMDHFGKQLIYPFIIYPFTSILYCLALTNKRIFSKTTDFEYHLQELRERLVNQGLDEQFSKSQNDRQK